MKSLKEFLEENAGLPLHISRIVERLKSGKDITTDEAQQLKDYNDSHPEKKIDLPDDTPRFKFPEGWERIYN
jgi:hypothetical protein